MNKPYNRNGDKKRDQEIDKLGRITDEVTIADDALKNVRGECKMNVLAHMQNQGISICKSVLYADASNKRLQ